MMKHNRYEKGSGLDGLAPEGRPSSCRPLRLAVACVLSGGLLGLMSNANAAAVITAMDFLADPADASLDSVTINNADNTIDVNKTLTSLAPAILRFTVEHAAGGGNQYAVSESILNDTGQAWTDFHYVVDGPNGVVFSNFEGSTLTGFDLEGPPASGPDALNFVGALPDGGSTDAAFMLSLNDPGADNSYTFDLVQTATVPVPAAAWLLGSALVGMVGVARRRKEVLDV